MFEDLDGDRTHSGESGLAAITVQLWHPDDGLVATGTTGAGGTYAFTGLSAGDYRMRIFLPAGYIQTTADPTDIGLAAGKAVGGIDFGAVLRLTWGSA